MIKRLSVAFGFGVLSLAAALPAFADTPIVDPNGAVTTAISTGFNDVNTDLTSILPAGVGLAIGVMIFYRVKRVIGSGMRGR